MKADFSVSIEKLLKILLLYIVSLSLLGRVLFVGASETPIGIVKIASAMMTGLVFDFILWGYFSVPIVVLGLFPSRIREQMAYQRGLFLLFFFEVALIGFATLCEQFFIDEFHARYNFIAVDYLVYSNEVFRNIWQSYPIEWIVPIYLFIAFALSRRLFRNTLISTAHMRFGKWRFAFYGTPLALIFLSVLFVREDQVLQYLEDDAKEVAKNTVHTLFSAYNNNEIPFQKFYATVPPSLAEETTSRLLNKQGPNHFVAATNKKRPLNVIIVLMESMSARFMGVFGEGSGLTPHLDQLAKEGLFFSRMYSTGTRTVRGIEAVTLSIPPTPGQSIVRRPESDGLFNIGTVFRSQGYSTEFLYGGRALFDNMGVFFSSNGFSVFDQTHFKDSEKTFENAWGVCDEDLFNFAIRRADQNVAEKKGPFFQIVLTTSNHRPYTYPDGRIDIPSHTGRGGAVKYADYSIGQLIKAAQGKPWFKDTVFVFVADHNASVAGGSKILPEDYHIPLIFYSPENIPAQTLSLLGSQIDLAPTLLGLLGFSYESKFFGHDLRRARSERAFLATYQDVGLWENNFLVILSPNQKIKRIQLDNDKLGAEEVYQKPPASYSNTPEILNAISIYQTASEWYAQRRLKESSRQAQRADKGD